MNGENLTTRLRIWLWVYCKLNVISANVWRKAFLKDENKLRGKYIARLANYVYQKKIAPYKSKRTSKENWMIISGEYIMSSESKLDKIVQKIERLKKQFSEDVCRSFTTGKPAGESRIPEPDSICQNRPPEITNLRNACLSCSLRETCKILFKE